MSAPLTLHESAGLLGRYRYVELLLFELLGERAPRAARAEVAIYLSGAARAHAYRAELFEAQLPVSVGLPDAAALTISPGPGLEAALRELAGLDDDGVLLGELLGVWYPAIYSAYLAHLEACSPAADPPIRRRLQRAGADVTQLIADGATLAISVDDARNDEALALLTRCGGPFGITAFTS
jgi:hypothetical protein